MGLPQYALHGHWTGIIRSSAVNLSHVYELEEVLSQREEL
jgi:hypothetical protein